MSTRVPLYDRLPEIYRVRDEEQQPPWQLRAYLAVVESAFDALHRNVEGLYRDLFIETCADWVVPYIGDLLGTSHLSGDPWTIRADVAETIALRRRKGTPSALERLAFVLTGWSSHVVELRETLAWAQHLNHQRPDAGGAPPYANATRFTAIRGGTAVVRDPATLSLLGTPFDPFARIADVRPPEGTAVRHNLPNVAVFLWRLEAYRVRAAHPVFVESFEVADPQGDEAVRAVRFHVDPLGRPLRLFNVAQHDPRANPPALAELDRSPGPIHPARLDEGAPAGNPEAYVSVETWDPTPPVTDAIELSDVGLQLHLPLPEFANRTWPLDAGLVPQWRIRSANLCAWDEGVRPPLLAGDVAIDPILGRVVFGLGTMADDVADVEADAAALEASLRVTYTYGAPGAVGAHPISRDAVAIDDDHDTIEVRFDDDGPDGLRDALADLDQLTRPLVVEIRDSATYRLDPLAIAGVAAEGGPTLTPAFTLVIRAASGMRPTVLLARPLRFRADDPADAARVDVRLEGIHIARDEGFPTGGGTDALVARAAVNSIEFDGCTLDPGGHSLANGDRAPLGISLSLGEGYGYTPGSEEEDAFEQTPAVVVRRSVTGALRVDRGYTLSLTESVVDAGGAVGEASAAEFAVGAVADAEWGPETDFTGLTAFGRVRVESIRGRGGIFTQRLEAQDDQTGCIRYSWVSGDGDRLPQNLGCVSGADALLRFDAVRWLDPAYARVGLASDFRVRERGPDDEAMGAYGFLREASKSRNLRIRFREFVPVGIRPLIVPVT